MNPGSAAESEVPGSNPAILFFPINGETVDSSNDLVTKLYTYAPGQVVQLNILRNGTQSEVAATLQTLSDTASASGAPADQDQGDSANPADSGNNLGLSYQDQTADIRQQLPAGAPKGPVVTGVDQQSPAAASGLQPGDVLLKAGNTALASSKQLTGLA